jgi:hypothetical protein
MLRPPRHRAPAAPPCRISAGMFRPIPSSNRRRAHRHPVAVRAAVPPARQRPLQARPPAPRVPAVQPRLRQRPRQLVRVACRTADATNSDREATPFWVAFRCPHPLMSIWRMHFNCPNKTAPAWGLGRWDRPVTGLSAPHIPTRQCTKLVLVFPDRLYGTRQTPKWQQPYRKRHHIAQRGWGAHA